MLVNELLGKLDCSHAELDYIVICCDGEDTCFDCKCGYLNRKGMINLYVDLETISDASVVVKISYAGALKYQRYIDATNVDEEFKNIEKCVEVFKENFIDSQTLLNELENF